METAQIFNPEYSSRQGERNAWILTGLAVLVEVVLFWRSSTLPGWMTLLTIFLLLSAIFISLGNWVDRKTILALSPEGLKFSNGLRKVRLHWDQVEKVTVIEDRWGQRVLVSGAQASFNFRTLSEVQLRGKVGGKMGFPEGESILKEILQASKLRLTKSDEQGYYYTRPVEPVARP